MGKASKKPVAQSVRSLVAGVLGSDNELAEKMLSVLGRKRAIRILNIAKGKTPDKRRRKQYVLVCLEKEVRVPELESLLADHPDVGEILTPEECREINPAELDAYHAVRFRLELELDLLLGRRPGYLLSKRVGQERTMRMWGELLKVFSWDDAYGHRRMHEIMSGAAAPQIKSPERYVCTAIENERRDMLD